MSGFEDQTWYLVFAGRHCAVVALAAGSKLMRVAAGETILRQGDHDNFACAILDGEADVFVEIPAGQIQMATVGHHRLIGEMGAMTEMPRSATVIARTRSPICASSATAC